MLKKLRLVYVRNSLRYDCMGRFRVVFFPGFFAVGDNFHVFISPLSERVIKPKGPWGQYGVSFRMN